jgi:hypothetical protein
MVNYDDPKICRQVCELTQQYIEWMVYRVCGEFSEVEKVLGFYTNPEHQPGDLSLQELYEHFLGHAANKSQGGPAIMKVFGKSQDTEEWQKLGGLLGNFEPTYVCDPQNYPNVAALRQAIMGAYGHTKFTGHVERYIITIFELGHYLQQYHNGEEVYAVLNHGYDENRTILIRKLIDQGGVHKNAFFGMGQALIRDALKELGYVNYVKPDGHIKDIAGLLKLSSEKDSDEKIAETLEEVAIKGSLMKPYQLDKFLFLIGSGNFYRHNQDTRDSRWKLFSKRNSIKRKVEFAEFVLERLESPPLKVGNHVALLVSNYKDSGLYRGQVGQIQEMQARSLVKVAFTDDKGRVIDQHVLFPTEFVVLQGSYSSHQ